MAEDDIYKSKRRYENMVCNFETLIKRPKKGGKSIYYCKNKINLKYFYQLCKTFETKDLSFIRRIRALSTLKMITYVIEKDLKECTRDDINTYMVFMHKRSKTISGKKSFIKDLKSVWRTLFPDLDHLGRPDETICPYVVRHINGKVDKSKQKMRNEKYTIEEFQNILKFFDNNPKIQAYITAIHETYTRPQELCYLKIRDFEFFDNYGTAYISEHGKEGTKQIQFESLSYPYVLKWYKQHPLKSDPDAYFFITEASNRLYKQLTNEAINRALRKACKALGIKKKITCYSLKRMGITMDRMNGVPDKIIIAKAGWTSGKQLATYDLGTRSEALRMSLIRKGLVNPKDENEKKFVPQQKNCAFCGHVNGHTDELCNGCHRPLDREKLTKMAEEHEKIRNNEMMQKMMELEKRFEGMLTP